MSAAPRLALYGLVLVAVFLVAYVAGGLLVPEHVVAAWSAAVPTAAH
ncbi:hypothetical protein GA0111570_109108 [Raineyella antarctica]|uniref:Uncharacterized protein n=1 Tax=Raineyella antarctica TaxID=1577474 RepID=A0A1G6HFT9_9ACTN|nr:hypothetical protein [Raineyella antarctica]SDB93112.1 hypothetical protein GA0111570_109108 [Raineyella antarctica]